ncbi:sigma-54-dependent transcriptional regulator [Desulfobacula phenolica]|uniref:Two-component system, NtrC family, response regulator n=1 Tax=Desulfobacula phenolica TaxID=90732 RepID=A0A1H2HWC9_9BACT|nr:sigma-54 dependent transcriptional regulator [Desulfobacula phenolica]SDU36025.1 two-component system, NtrC family, response regulator [Desulfobacula phenolica]
MPNVLIIDDDEQICKLLSKVFNRMGYTASYQLTLKEGLDKIISEYIDIVFLDVNLPDGNGLDAIEIIKQLPLAPEIIIITADEDIDGAELAMRSNAWDYISKRESHRNFKFALERALEYRRQKQAKSPEKPINCTAIIGKSRLISNCLDKISTAAHNDLPVLITGETGTGKELFSRAIHDNSKRSHEEFVVVDCASLPEHLVENTLFGHSKGAFTGADSDKTGLMEMADKGTLFLDEVGELPLDVQKKFLRVLQEKIFRPIGSKKEVKSDFRLICATHRDIAAMVKQNKFREDLFFRLFSMNIHLPPLKDRKEDIITLAQHHLNSKKDLSGKNCTMSREFSEELKFYEWPGNVRELINTIDLVFSEAGDGTTLFPHHLPENIRAVNIRNKIKAQNKANKNTPSFFPNKKKIGSIPKLKDHIENTKHAYIQNLISVTQGNIKETCRISGLSRGHIYRLLQQYNIKGV